MAFVKQNLMSFILAVVVMLVGGLSITWGRHSSIWVGIGGSLLAAAFISFLDLVKRFNDVGVDVMMASAKSAGVRELHPRRNVSTYPELVRKAPKIDVAGYSLRNFADQHGATIRERAALGDLKVRILLVDPTSQASFRQAAAEKAEGASFAVPVQKVIDDFGGIAGVEIELISRALPSMYFRIGDRLFVGPQFSKPSTSVGTFELTSGWMFQEYETEFDALWREAAPPAPGVRFA